MNFSEDFISHLDELRRRIMICLGTFLAASIICYFFSHPLLVFLTEPLRRFHESALFFNKPYEAFLIHLRVSAFSGLFFSSPILLMQLWLFIAPGLYQREKRMAMLLVVSTVLLFLGGAFFAFYVVVPAGLHFLLSFQTESLKPLLGVDPYFSFLMGMVLACGILFDFPIFIIGLVRLHVLKSSALRKARKVMIVIIFVLAALLTPSPDPFSQLLLAAPLLFLFEISLWIAGWVEKRNRPI